MNNEQKFWITVWILTAIVVVTFITKMAEHNIQEDLRVTEMVLKKDYTPLEAYCAFNGKATTCKMLVMAK